VAGVKGVLIRIESGVPVVEDIVRLIIYVTS
jgi:hypothetical protein